MKRVWSTLAGYLWWTYPRGSVHYDVMVTLILAFIFLAPLRINFKDKPLERPSHPTRIVVMSDPAGGNVYRVDAAAVQGSSDEEIHQSLLRIIEPITPGVEIARWEPVKDPKGQLAEYKVWTRP